MSHRQFRQFHSMPPQRRFSRFYGRSSCQIGLIALLLSLMQLPPALAQSVPAPVQEGFSLLDQNLVDQSIPLFRSAIRQYPQSAEARLGLAIAYRRAGRTTEALTAYEDVLTVDPSNRLALLTIGILGGYDQKWQDRGIAALDTLLSLDPTDTEARAQRALLYGYQGRFGEAIADYEQVLQQSDPLPDVLLGAAQVYSYGGEYETSLDLFERYQQTGGSIDGDAATAYARALRETGNPQLAVQVLEPQLAKISGINGVAIRLRAELGMDYGAIEQFAQAEETLAPLRGRGDSRMILARSLLGLVRYGGEARYINEAVALFQDVLTRSPEFLTIGIGQEIADRISAYPSAKSYALEIYRQLSAQQPTDLSLQIPQAILEWDLGKISKAALQQRLETALQPLPSEAYQQTILAEALTRLDFPDPALLPLYQSLLPTGVPLLYFRIAQIQLQQGDLDAARQTLATYSSTDEGQRNPETSELLLAEIDRQGGNLDAAAQRYEAILAQSAIDPGITSSALQGLAGIRQSQGRLPEAVEIYDRLVQLNPKDDAKPLGRASLAYQANLISQAEAEAVLNQWVATHELNNIPPELVSLVAALPPDPDREPLYTALLAGYSNNIPLQLRYVQVLAERDPRQAEAYVRDLIANDPENVGAYFVQAEVAQRQGNLNLASASYEAVLDQQPRNADALTGLGGVRFQQRRYDSAVQLYSNALTLEPDNAIAQSALVNLTALQGRRLDALQQLEELQGEQPSAELQRQQQLIEEGFLQQRGFQPPWERY